MISKCLRGFIKAVPGNVLIGGDFSNVEGRGIAWLAGEQWKLDAFARCDANPDLPDMYERTYAKTFNRDPNNVTKEERQIGKVEELAFGYQGGVGAFRTMGKTYNVRGGEVARRSRRSPDGFQIVTETRSTTSSSAGATRIRAIKQYWYDLQARDRRGARARRDHEGRRRWAAGHVPQARLVPVVPAAVGPHALLPVPGRV
jgi:hypothetical protein